ncbi:GNAT family N-acetyltransferase [Clostridium sp. Marseille-P299]|uniref:GNAT family N-acetyltransferase n=1 Tax=Clostridium sp. Marseille-P299 TaxID=1805477 RepID=UPI00082D479D|nr:GNAT family N-acetyltransferase [Clostridium sp. Marseille-P299]
MLKIVRANIEDAGIITRIKISAYNKEINTYLGRNGGPPGYAKMESQINIIKKYIAYKITLDNQIIGAFFLIPISSTIMRFEDFVIEPFYQNKGFGYRVLELVEREYSDILVWKLSTPIFSIGNQYLYKKFGFVEVSRDEEEIEYVKMII